MGMAYCKNCRRPAEDAVLVLTDAGRFVCAAHFLLGDCEAALSELEHVAETFAEYEMDYKSRHALRAEIDRRRLNAA